CRVHCRTRRTRNRRDLAHRRRPVVRLSRNAGTRSRTVTLTQRLRFESPARSERVASILGLALGVTFTICFATGLYSHLLQDPARWSPPPARPAGLYRVTQGLHVATGIASIPLVFAKLWSVFPKLFRWPPFDGFAHAVERIALVPLVGGALFELLTGVA